MDIRKYFGSKPTQPSSGAPPKSTSDGKRKKMVLSDSSDEEEPAKLPKTEKTSRTKDTLSKETRAPAKTQLKEVTASEFFGATTSQKQPNKNLLSPASQNKESKAVQKEAKDRPKKEAKDTPKKNVNSTPSHKRKEPEDENSERKSSSKKARTSHQSPADKEEKSRPKSLASKLAQFARSEARHASSDDDFVPEVVKKEHKKSPRKAATTTPKKKEEGHEAARTPKSGKKTDSHVGRGQGAAHLDASSLNESASEIPGTPQEEWEEKKKHRVEAYHKFLSRGGARHPGSKQVPEGAPNCLAGLVFVLSGVYESLEREEMSDIIKKYGGKVTTSVSRNTSYLVRGEEAGQSKLEKADKLGTKQITEDGFLQLIRDQSLGAVKEKENKTPSPEVKREPARTKEEPRREQPSSAKAVSPPKRAKTEVKQEETRPKPKTTPLEEAIGFHIPKIRLPESKPIPALSSESHMGEETELFVDKYRPLNCKSIIGQQGDRSNMNKLKIWLQNWNQNHLHKVGKGPAKPAPWGAANDNGAWAKCALLSGPPGIGKTTTAYLVCQELGYDVVEFNASDTRSKKLLHEHVASMLNNTSVSSLFHHTDKVNKKRVLLMDEVDGMAGNEDRGGVAELINLIKATKVPVIAMCNDRNHPKIRSLANHCFDLRFQRPKVEQIKAAMMSVCFKEKIKIKPEALTELIIGCGQDVRQVLHHLSMVRASQQEEKMGAEQAKREAEAAKKTSVKIGPWDVCKKVFSQEDHRSMSFIDKSDLYFYDYNLAGLFVQENYLAAKPAAAGGDMKKTMALVSRAADSIAEGDIVERNIRSGMAWGLLPTAAVFCSVLPGEYMSGYLTGQIQFPAWLGKNSRKNKIDRILQELEVHTRLSAGVSKKSFNLEYAQSLRDHIIMPLVKQGADGIEEAVQTMEKYALLREDLDGLLEVAQWPHRPDPMKGVDTKVKTAFTRRYNKEGGFLPYSVVQHVKKKAAAAAEFSEFGDEEIEEEDDEDEDDSIEADAMIKVKKPTAGKGKKVEEEKEAAAPTTSKGKGKAKKK